MAADGATGMSTTEAGVTEVESLCVNCYETGVTRMLLTSIPMFRDVVIMSFECSECNFRNSEIQSAASVQEQGATITLKVETREDLNRQVVHSENASWSVPELEFESPNADRKGFLNTVEGCLQKAYDGLNMQQEQRREEHPEVAAQIDAFLARLRACITLETPFTMVLDDPAGNSFIEPLVTPVDPQLTTELYTRTLAQARAMGLSEAGTDSEPGEAADHGGHGAGHDASLAAGLEPVAVGSSAVFNQIAGAAGDEAIVPDEVMILPENCYACFRPGQLRILMAEIPHFRTVCIWSFLCDECGARSVEIKSGGAVSAKGERIVCEVSDPSDLARDVLKSDTAGIEVPELDLELTPGTLGGKYTTIEGLMSDIRTQLESINPFRVGDGQDEDTQAKWRQFFDDIDAMIAGDMPFTFIMDDPVANSMVQNMCAPDDDPKLVIEQYVRTHDQDDALGLLDMQTEGYEGWTEDNHGQDGVDDEDGLDTMD